MIDERSLEALRKILDDARRRGFVGPGPTEAHIRRSLDFLEALPEKLSQSYFQDRGGDGTSQRRPGPRLASGIDPQPGVDPTTAAPPPSGEQPAVTTTAFSALDLGSGAGIPGLVLALALPRSRWVLLEASQKRAAFLIEAVHRLRLEPRVVVVAERAEETGRGPMRGSFDLVVARSFAAPAVTAECAAPFLRTGGLLVVAEPPSDAAGTKASQKLSQSPQEGASSATPSHAGVVGRWPPEVLATLGLVPMVHVATPSALQVLEQRVPCPARYPRRTGLPSKRPLF